MAGSTWKWLGGTASGGIAANWTLVAGAGNLNGYPQAGDTVIDTGGTVILGTGNQISNATIEAGGTAGAIAGLAMTGDNTLSFGSPSFDGTTVLTSAVPGQSTAEMTVLNAVGSFVNDGTIIANGPAGSSFQLNVQPNASGTGAPGYFLNYGTIQANAGNAMAINIAGNAALFNAGRIVANGGSIFINAATNALDGGYAGVSGLAIIEGGGTFETNISIASTLGYFGPTYVFGDTTAGNTLKIDNIKGFDAGNIAGFSAGDTIDLGTVLSVGTIVYGTTAGALGLLQIEDTTGSVVASLLLSGVHNYGTFAVVGGQADGFVFGTGPDGDTVLTTTNLVDAWNNTSGSWLTAANWSLGSVPGTTTGAEIGLNATNAFTLTTGSTPLAMAGFSVDDPNALVQITSNTTVENTNGASSVVPSGISQYNGTLEVTSGNTLTLSSLVQYSPGAELLLDPGSLLDVLGHPNASLPVNGVISINNGNSTGVRIAGTAIINDATLNAGPTQTAVGASGGSFYIGYGYPGTPASITVSAGGVVSDTFSVLGSDPTSFGMLTLTGAGTTWTDAGDPNDLTNTRGYMQIGNNGYAGSTPAGIAQPPFAGTAQLTVQNGATLNEASFANIASSADSAGSVSVSSGAHWNINDWLLVGRAGLGTMSVTAGGTVSIGAGAIITSNGTAQVDNFALGVGLLAGSTGSLTVSDAGSSLTAQNAVLIGNSGVGTLAVQNSAVFNQAGYAAIGAAVGGSGTAAVSTGAQWNIGNTGADTGFLDVGRSGRGSLLITNNGTAGNGGTVSVGAGGTQVANGVTTISGPAVDVGRFAGSSGTLTVDGSGSALMAQGGIVTGDSGFGTLTVQNGATANSGGGLVLGNNGGASGTVTVNGSGLGAASITVGNTGLGVLTGQGGTINAAGALLIGNGNFGIGTVTVNGGRLSVGSAVVGGGGSGVLTIQNGGTVQDSTGLIVAGGTNFQSSTLTVRGSGSALTVGGSGIEIAAGANENAIFNVQTQAVVSTTTLALGGSGAAPIGGRGTVALTGTSDLNASAAVAVWAGSTLSVDASSAIDIGGSNDLAGTIAIEAGHALLGSGRVLAPVVDNGTILAVGSAGANVFTQGMLEIGGSITGSGQIQIGDHAVLQLDSTLPSAMPIFFGAGSELILNAPGAGFSNPIFGLSVGDKIDLNLGAGVFINNAFVSSPGTVTVVTNSGTYLLTNVSFAAGTQQQFWWGTDFANGASMPDIQVAPDVYNWLGNGGTDLGTAANWQDQSNNHNPALTPPNAGVQVNFNNNPGTLTGTLSALNANFGNNGNSFATWTLNNVNMTLAGDPSPPFLPNSLNIHANLVINGGTLNAAAGSSNIGGGGTPVTVTAQGGARVTTMGDIVGNGSGQIGALILNGAGVTWTEQNAAINGSGAGYMSVGQGNAGFSGGGAAGYLTIENGAVLNTGSFANAGFNQGDFGSVAVTGAGLWNIGSGLNVGLSGEGNLYVSNGTVLSGGYIGVGQNSGSSGTVTVNTGTLATNGMNVGNAGQGTVAVSGGTLSNAGFTSLGFNAGSSGTITVSGGLFSTNGLTVGNSGQGMVALNNSVLTSAQFVTIGQNNGAEGSVVLTPGAVFTASTGLNIGTNGSGTLSVGGGTVTAGGFSQLGVFAGSTGAVSVSANGILTNVGGLNIGASGAGGLTATAGAIVSSTGGINIGQNTGGLGAVSVSGGSHFDESGLTVGNSGIGTLTVSGGEITDAGGLFVGNSVGGAGVMNVSSATASVSSFTIIGNNGADGTLVVGSGGTILANGTFDAIGNNVGATGTLVVNGGGEFLAAGSFEVGNNAGSNGLLVINQGGTVKSTMAPQLVSTAVIIGRSGASGSTPAANGAVLVTGPGALLDTNGNPLAIGGGTGNNLNPGNYSGNGSLTITQGGSVAVASLDSNQFYSLGVAANGTGGSDSVEISDLGSQLSAQGYVIIGRSGEGSLLVQNQGVMLLSDAVANGGGLGIGVGRGGSVGRVGGSGEATVTTGGVIDNTSTTSGITVGGHGANGVLNVNSGGTVLAGTALTVGTATQLSGTIYGGTGELNIGAGGTVLVNNPIAANGYDVYIGNANASIGTSTTGSATGAASGQALVSGVGALLDGNGGGIAVGWLSSGDLTVSQGGTVLADTADSKTTSALSVGRRAEGSVTVTDAGSSLIATGEAYFGRSGSGNLLVEKQAVFRSINDPTGAAGISIGGIGGISQTGTLSYIVTGGSGSALVTSGGSMYSQGYLQVGVEGVAGALTIDNSGFAEAATQIVIGNSTSVAAGDSIITPSGSFVAAASTIVAGSGVVNIGAGGTLIAQALGVASGAAAISIGGGINATGALNVSGAGASVTAQANGTDIGDAGTGALTVSQGGSVNDIATVIGNQASGSGVLTVRDAGSSYTAQSMVVGEQGNGQLVVENQGTVIASSASGPSFVIGDGAGGVGNVLVTGAGSRLINANGFDVGGRSGNATGGLGSLVIANGGVVQTGTAALPTPVAATIGETSGSDGSSVTVTGANSTWQVTGQLDVGDNAAGALFVAAGGTVSATTLQAGVAAGSSGNINLQGAGSQLNVATSMRLGVAGSAVLTVGAGAILSVGQTLVAGAHSVVNMQGGTIDPIVLQNLARNGGTGLESASLEIDNAGTYYASNGTFTLNAPVVHQGSLGSTGVLEIDTNGNLAVNAAVDATQSVMFTGAGTLDIGAISRFHPSAISGFAAGDTIVVDGVGALAQSFNSGTDQLVLTDQVNNHYTLQFAGAHTAADFTSSVVAGSLTANGAWASDSAGDFDDPTRWIGGVVPSGNTDAVIDFTDQPQVVHSAGTDTLYRVRNIAGNFVMAGGTLAVNVLENDSTASWSGGSLVLNPGTEGAGFLLNASGATLAIAANGQRLSVAPGNVVFNNAGTILGQGGSGIANIDAALNNTGTLLVNQGTLSLNGGGSSNGTGLQTSITGMLQFGAPASGPGGDFVITGGQYAVLNTTISGGTLDVSAASSVFFVHSLRLAGAGTLLLGAQNAAAQTGFIQGPASWGGSTGTPFLSGTGTLSVFNGGVLISGVESGSGLTRLVGTSQLGGGTQLDGGRTVENDGWMNWSFGDIVLGSGDAAAATHTGTVTNAANATFYVTADARMANQAGGSRFNNAGVSAFFSGVGQTDIDAAVVNTGFIQAQSGTLSLNGGGSSAGDHLFVTANAILQFGTQANGAGGTFTITGAQYIAAHTWITGGTLDVSASSGAVMANQLRMTAGGLQLGAAAGTVQGTLQQSGGIIAGSGTLSVFGGESLTGGVQSGAGTTKLAGTGNIGTGFQVDGGRTISNSGWLNWSSGNIVLGSGDASAAVHSGTLSNASGGMLYVTSNGRIGTGSGTGVVNNAGVIAVFAGAGETDIDAVLNSTGGLQVQSGTLSLNGGGTIAAANVFVGPNGVLQFGTSASTGQGGAFTFTGSPYIASNTVVQAGTVDMSAVGGISFGNALSLSGGKLLLGGNFPSTVAFTQSGGLLSGTGFFKVTGPAQLTGGVETGSGRTVLKTGGAISGSVSLDGGRSIENDGTLVWTGGTITLGAGDAGASTHAATLYNIAGSVLNIQADGAIANASSGAISNAGTILKSGGLGTTTIGATLFNSGVVDTAAGKLVFSGAVSGAGSFLLDGSATLDFASAVSGSETMRFLHPGGTLAVDTTGQFGAVISGFGGTDVLDATPVSAATAVKSFNAGTLTVSDGSHSVAFQLNGSYSATGFHLATDGHGGTAVTYS